jgi:hypothetical protein
VDSRHSNGISSRPVYAATMPPTIALVVSHLVFERGSAIGGVPQRREAKCAAR